MDEALVAEVVRQVMALLAGGIAAAGRQPVPSGRRVVALFSGASTGVQEGLETVRWLSGAGHQVTAILSAGGAHMAPEERLREAGAQTILGPQEWINTPILLREHELVIIPTLSMNFAAHLALGLMDSPGATLVTGALLAGKPVIALQDGADPDGAGGRVFGAVRGGAAALRTRLQNNLKTLASYGVELVSQAEFLIAVQRSLGRQAESTVKTASVPTGPSRATIITQVDVENLQPGSLFRIPPGSRLTPLAAEALTRLQIQVIDER